MSLRTVRRSPRGKHGGRRGAVLIEAAIVLPVLLLITLGLVEFGHLFHVKHALTGAARHGARTAIVPSATNTAVEAAVEQMMTASGISSEKYTVSIEGAAGSAVNVSTVAAGTNITVRVESSWGTIGIRPLSLIDAGKTVWGAVVMKKEGPGT